MIKHEPNFSNTYCFSIRQSVWRNDGDPVASDAREKGKAVFVRDVQFVCAQIKLELFDRIVAFQHKYMENEKCVQYLTWLDSWLLWLTLIFKPISVGPENQGDSFEVPI